MALRLTQPDERLVIADTDLPAHEPALGDVDPEVTYTIRRLTPGEMDRLRAPYVRYAFSRTTHKKEELPLSREDAETFANVLIDAIVVGWTGIRVGDAEAPCDATHKALLDPLRKGALVRAALVNHVEREAARHDSFRSTAGVGDVVA
jgi:hypothetical protein